DAVQKKTAKLIFKFTNERLSPCREPFKDSHTAIDKDAGASDIIADGIIKVTELKLSLSGASDLKAKLQVDKLTVDISGASDLSINGSATDLKIEASGASKFKGFDLATDYCVARASGASDIDITVNKELSVHASGASDIDYKGAGVIRDLHTSGASSVSRHS
ncbi:MAG: DUF2807 domain-containing protein, partial [Chitinophagaceae bacterium]